jgi:hypothetical protein
MLGSRRKAGGIVLQATASELHPDSLRLRSVAS